MEDAGRECFLEGMRQADTVILLEIPRIVRKKRILSRWIRQNLGLEPCLYRPHWEMLKAMFRWARNYDTGRDGTKERVARFADKTVTLHGSREIRTYLRTLDRIR